MINNNLTSNEKNLPSGQIKFDYHSGREIVFGGIAAVGLLVMLFGCPLTMVYIHSIIIAGLLTALVGFLLLVAGMKLYQFTKDYLILDTGKNEIYSNKGFFRSKTTFLCRLDEIKEVSLLTESAMGPRSSVREDRRHIRFFLEIRMPDYNTVRCADTVFAIDETGCQFNSEIAKLRDYALKIASASGCNITYSHKIPEKEQLQPAC